MVGESYCCPTINSDVHLNHTQSINILNDGWNQVPPVYMPWTSLPENQVTRFSGETSVESAVREAPDLRVCPWIPPENRWNTPKTLKRKSEDGMDTDLLNEPIPKQLITEEKITAHLSRLHISGTSAQEQLLPNSTPEPPIPPPQSEKTSENPLERLVKGGSRIVLAEEVQNLRQESCIPPALLEHLTRPTMAVVLWQPPGSAVNNIISAVVNRQRRRNGLSEPTAQPPAPEPAVEEDSNNNEPMNNFNWNVNGAPDRQTSDVDMDEQDL